MDEKELMDAVDRAAKTDEKRVHISLAEIDFLSSGMITALVCASKHAKSLGVEIGFVHASPNVIEVLKITNLNKLFRVEGESE